mmetsp:Transcript_11447/g.26478  ORF Transcript_11447/g.26478 Transcript_11447/m.26478 type:complete len:309 (-) Transcript_11447:128-1054(-)|eukprot:CAMPEP_0178417334 /NCGR_PEP_ID=MMETSP0689_2-20121128/24520_1 /TAXON_ID=160604 /ORGANISM="Amphidinium massartii, Strain CS-259" /LENGTH=308 /DNA_ID=CAMNT_0020038695 /DNA_START=42 /DNA_END=968 /DNA_ORIENTATION=+
MLTAAVQLLSFLAQVGAWICAALTGMELAERTALTPQQTSEWSPSVILRELPYQWDQLHRRLQRVDNDWADENPGLILLFRLAPLIVAVIVLIVALVISFAYNARVTSKRSSFVQRPQGTPSSTGADFTTPPFGCCDDTDYCILGACCFSQRYADTLQAVGVMSYWPVVLALTLMDVLVVASYASPLPVNPILLLYWLRPIFLMMMRGKIRAAIGKNPSTDLFDVIFWCCCGCCAAVQEAREVDRETNTKVTACCCALTQLEPSTVVGQPVTVGGPIQGQAYPAVVVAGSVVTAPAKGEENNQSAKVP